MFVERTPNSVLVVYFNKGIGSHVRTDDHRDRAGSSPTPGTKTKP